LNELHHALIDEIELACSITPLEYRRIVDYLTLSEAIRYGPKLPIRELTKPLVVGEERRLLVQCQPILEQEHEALLGQAGEVTLGMCNVSRVRGRGVGEQHAEYGTRLECLLYGAIGVEDLYPTLS
jgi:hypothetical protein